MLTLILAALQATAAAIPSSVPSDWRARPMTAGTWTWRNAADASEAVFSDMTGPQLIIRCTRANRRVSFVRTGTPQSAQMRVATTSSERLLPPGNTLLANDPLLDAIAFSRGRLWVDVQGRSPLILRSAAEAARSIEDCRS